MTHDPRTVDELYEELRDNLVGRITKLTNFTDRSFNYVWTRAVAHRIRELELRTFATELSGWVDYAGGPVTDTQLDKIGVADSVEPEEINQYLDDNQLDELVKIVGVERFPGSRATGTVDIETDPSRDITIQEGLTVTTSPDTNGDTIEFEVTETVTVSDGTSVGSDIEIEAVEIGVESNVPAGTIVRIADPPIGVSGVTNPSATTGGSPEETNEDLRERAKSAVIEQAGGGTVEGIKGYIISEVDAVQRDDVLIEEFTDPCPPYVDVIVDGGSDEDVEQAIEESRPVAIEHFLIRPETTQIGVDLVAQGEDIDQTFVRDEIEDYLLELGLSQTFFENEVIKTAMNADDNIINIGQLETEIESVSNEGFTFDDAVDRYKLEYTFDDSGDISIVDSSGEEYDYQSDFYVIDETGDGYPETIDWSIRGFEPDDGVEFFVDYAVNSQLNIVRDEQNTFETDFSQTFTFDPTKDFYRLDEVPFESSVSITDDSGDTYTRDTDYTVESRPEDSQEDTLTFQSGRTDYRLDFYTKSDTVSIEDADGDSYTRGTDYTVVDATGDGQLRTIRWDTNESTPADGEEYIVSYESDNYIPQSIVWDDDASTPDDAEDFTVTYDRAFYSLQYEVVDAPDDILRDETGTTYTEDTEYEFADYTADGEDDGVLWIDGEASPADSELFYITYFNEGNREFAARQRADPGAILVTEK